MPAGTMCEQNDQQRADSRWQCAGEQSGGAVSINFALGKKFLCHEQIALGETV